MPESLRRAGAFLLRRVEPTWRELFAVFVLLSAVGAVIYQSHIRHGGLYSDDWAFASIVDNTNGPFDAYDALRGQVGFRPLGILSIVARFTLFGDHPKWHLAAAFASTILLCWAFYLLLRKLRMEPLHAGAISLLVLVCPYADATRLWATGSGANLAIALWMLGVVVAFRGFDSTTRRAGILLHAGAVVLYLTSLLLYEVSYLLVVGSGLLYLTRASWRRVLPYCAVDIVLASIAVAAVAANGAVDKAPSYLHHAKLMLDGGLQILGSVALPYGVPRTGLVVGLLAVLAACAVTAWLLLPRRTPERREIERWLLFAGGGIAAAAAGYGLYIAAIYYYSPLSPGLANRINAIPTMGFIVTVYSLALLTGTLLFRRFSRGRVLAAAAAIAVAAFIFIGFQDRLRDSVGIWDRAYAYEEQVLWTVRDNLPDLPSGSTVLTFGHPTVSEDPGLPIFSSFWELRGAVQVTYDDPTVAAYPALPATQLQCDRHAGHLEGGGYDPSMGDRYGELYLVDVPSQRVERVTSQRACRAAARRFLPGPAQAAPPTP